MWRSEKARNDAILRLLEAARLYSPNPKLDRGLWLDGRAGGIGPTSIALSYLRRGSPLSHGETLILKVALDLWNGGGRAEVGELLDTLDARNLRAVVTALLARDGGGLGAAGQHRRGAQLRRRELSAMKAVLCKPGEDAQVVDLADTLRALQTAVGGPVGTLKLSGGLAGGIMAYVHDEGVLVGLTWNRQLGPRTYVAGPIVALGFDEEGEDRSLDSGEQLDVLRLFNVIAPRLEAVPATMEKLEQWLGEKAVRFYAGGEEVCGECSAKLEPERKGFCPKCHSTTERRP